MKETMSEKGRVLLAKWEGLRREVYRDSAGHETIGVGHLLTAKERRTGILVIDGVPAEWRKGLTRAQCLALLGQDLERFEAAVAKAVGVPLEWHQRDALISFAFNVGTGAFGRSTLVKRLNAGRYDEVPAQLRRWNKAGGRVVQGLGTAETQKVGFGTE